VVMILPNMVKT